MKYEKIFFAIIFPLTYLLSLLFLSKGLNSVLTIIMILPTFAAVVSILLEYRSFIELLKPFFQKISLKSITFSLLFPIAVLMLCIFLTLTTKQGILISNWNYVITKIGIIILVSIVFFVIGLCEEHGWMGYLFPKLIKKFSFKKAALINGIILVCYQFPIAFILNIHYGLIYAAIYTLFQLLSTFAMNYAFTYLFTLSPNVIIPSIMRSLWKNLNLAILGYSYKSIPFYGCFIGKPHIISGEGLFGAIFLSIFAIYAYIKFLNMKNLVL